VEENSTKGEARLLFSETRGREQRPQQLPFVEAVEKIQSNA